jgi:hypothetical protein
VKCPVLLRIILAVISITSFTGTDFALAGPEEVQGIRTVYRIFGSSTPSAILAQRQNVRNIVELLLINDPSSATWVDAFFAYYELRDLEIKAKALKMEHAPVSFLREFYASATGQTNRNPFEDAALTEISGITYRSEELQTIYDQMIEPGMRLKTAATQLNVPSNRFFLTLVAKLESAEGALGIRVSYGSAACGRFLRDGEN